MYDYIFSRIINMNIIISQTLSFLFTCISNSISAFIHAFGILYIVGWCVSRWFCTASSNEWIFHLWFLLIHTLSIGSDLLLSSNIIFFMSNLFFLLALISQANNIGINTLINILIHMIWKRPYFFVLSLCGIKPTFSMTTLTFFFLAFSLVPFLAAYVRACRKLIG